MDDEETNRKFAESLEADYPILSDPSKTTAEKYGVLSPNGVARRWTFYIGPDGKVLYVDKAVRIPTAGQDIADRLQELGTPPAPAGDATKGKV